MTARERSFRPFEDKPRDACAEPHRGADGVYRNLDLGVVVAGDDSVELLGSNGPGLEAPRPPGTVDHPAPCPGPVGCDCAPACVACGGAVGLGFSRCRRCRRAASAQRHAISRVEVETVQYERAHGKLPRGRGSWAFCPREAWNGPDYLAHTRWFSNLTWSAAKRAAIESFRSDPPSGFSGVLVACT